MDIEGNEVLRRYGVRKRGQRMPRTRLWMGIQHAGSSRPETRRTTGTAEVNRSKDTSLLGRFACNLARVAPHFDDVIDYGSGVVEGPTRQVLVGHLVWRRCFVRRISC